MKFFPFDLVNYVGDKFRQEIKDKTGEIVGPVGNEVGVYVVEFPNDTYVLSEQSLSRYRPSAKDASEPIINIRRKRFNLEED